MIFNTYAKGSDYNDAIPDFNDSQGEDPRKIDDENLNKEFIMRIFPYPDW